MRWLSTANFLRGSWLSSHTSYSGVNKCLVQGWVGGYDNFFCKKNIILMWWKERNSKNKWNMERRRRRKKKTYQSRRPNEIHLAVLCDEAAKQMLITINGAIPRYVGDWCNSLMLSGAQLLWHDSNHITSSLLFLCPISFTIKLPEKHAAVMHYWGAGRGHSADTYCHSALQKELQWSISLIIISLTLEFWTERQTGMVTETTWRTSLRIDT